MVQLNTNATIWMRCMDADKAYREKARNHLYKNATSYIEQILERTSHKTVAVRPPNSNLLNHPNHKKQDMRNT